MFFSLFEFIVLNYWSFSILLNDFFCCSWFWKNMKLYIFDHLDRFFKIIFFWGWNRTIFYFLIYFLKLWFIIDPFEWFFVKLNLKKKWILHFSSSWMIFFFLLSWFIFNHLELFFSMFEHIFGTVVHYWTTWIIFLLKLNLKK